MDMYPHTHAVCNLEMIRMCKKFIKVGSGHVFVVLGALVTVLTPISGCHSNANFAWASMIFILVKVKYV